MNNEILEFALAKSKAFAGSQTLICVSLQYNKVTDYVETDDLIIYLKQGVAPEEAAAALTNEFFLNGDAPTLIALCGDWPSSYTYTARQTVLQAIWKGIDESGTLLRVTKLVSQTPEREPRSEQEIALELAPFFRPEKETQEDGYHILQALKQLNSSIAVDPTDGGQTDDLHFNSKSTARQTDIKHFDTTSLLNQAISHANLLIRQITGVDTNLEDPTDYLIGGISALAIELDRLRAVKTRDISAERETQALLLKEIGKLTAMLSYAENRASAAEHLRDDFEAEVSALLSADASHQIDLENARKSIFSLKEDVANEKRHREETLRRLAEAVNHAEKLKQQNTEIAERDFALTGRPFKKRGLAKKDSRPLRVAGVMDEFTTACYAPECDYLALSPENWHDELIDFRPDIIFIESAWHGNGGLWHLKVSTFSTELENVLRWAKAAGVPSIFWNKEDPVHFASFIEVAEHCDVVFTTDIDCIPRYKEKLKHDCVYLLPFAAQPTIHHPIEELARKDAFNFAGSYYLRYPERQRDIETIIQTVNKFRLVEIYDRNYNREHPHYRFPKSYEPLILGNLPFAEIHKAYKGYAYGINMNTIKQSQSMFARRIYELLASNTVVVSNFSRGVRLLFGDLVICSDNGPQIQQRLTTLTEQSETYRKFRLLGLRKVMSEHTYGARLHYILSKTFLDVSDRPTPKIAIVAFANTEEQKSKLLQNWSRQTYQEGRLFVVSKKSASGGLLPASVYEATTTKQILTDIEEYRPTLIGGFVANDYYGPNYLKDFSLGLHYTSAAGMGKRSYFDAGSSNTLALKHEGAAYAQSTELFWRSAVFLYSSLTSAHLQEYFGRPEHASIQGDSLIGLDEFNYCRNGAQLDGTTLERVDDLVLGNTGIEIQKLLEFGEHLPESGPQRTLSTDSLPTLGPDHFSSYLKSTAKDGIRFGKTQSEFVVYSELSAGAHRYLWMNRKFAREDLNLVDNSSIDFRMTTSAEQAHLVIEFQDNNDQKVGHTMLPKGGNHSLAIPSECSKLRIGLRLMGPGEFRLTPLHFGTARTLPFALVSANDTLFVSRQYPTYQDERGREKLHERLLAYRKQGIGVDIFRLNTSVPRVYEEFENFDIASGDGELLDATLAEAHYKHVLVQSLDSEIWNVLSKHLDHLRVTIWIDCAGSWDGGVLSSDRQVDSESGVLEEAELDNKLWQAAFANGSSNLHFIFTSQYAVRRATEGVGIGPQEGRYTVIYDHVDESAVRYIEKLPDQRKKILSIGSYCDLKYGGDMTVGAIVELSKRPVFSALSFYLVGTGDLFSSLTEPLKNFANVTLLQRDLSTEEASALYKRYGVFLAPIREDGEGHFRAEAMASGLVPVVTKAGACPEFVDRGSGILVPPENPVALADAVEGLYTHPREFLRRSKGAAERVQSQSNFKQTIMREVALIKGAPAH